MEKILIKKPVGVTIAKNNIPITRGEIKLPKKKPNLAQILFRGVSRYGFNIPKVRKTTLTARAQTLISSLFNKGQRDIIRKKIKKTTPKLLFELIFVLFLTKLD